MPVFRNFIGVLGKIYLWLVSLFIISIFVFIFLNEGLEKIQEILSAFNMVNFIATMIILAPGLGLIMWSNRIKQYNYLEKFKKY
ncbi:MAG TPA: hypothetical protein EYQ84_04905 [Nitrospinaceae bacterium]|nr:hypothetical protein [Nitrospinaceae bacterium]